jgi:4-hydroxy 2-oxovalerate aldolase
MAMGCNGTSFNYGFGAHTDWEWLEAVADVLTTSVLTTLILPGPRHSRGTAPRL